MHAHILTFEDGIFCSVLSEMHACFGHLLETSLNPLKKPDCSEKYERDLSELPNANFNLFGSSYLAAAATLLFDSYLRFTYLWIYKKYIKYYATTRLDSVGPPM